ncbi:hypothetical protein [Albibacterium sp.]|uniref:hypothetical protein n=1 Tax=Albibacterium sp. TaxID=2952885 RepID=UPI002D1D0362|nr:hypothetical protein [Albibacterium sp.]HUH18541.1 hypothetical protein [Albibacterium sp.]
MEENLDNVENEFAFILYQQQLQTAAATESLAAMLLDDEQFRAYKMKKLEFMQEKALKIQEIIKSDIEEYYNN